MDNKFIQWLEKYHAYLFILSIANCTAYNIIKWPEPATIEIVALQVPLIIFSVLGIYSIFIWFNRLFVYTNNRRFVKQFSTDEKYVIRQIHNGLHGTITGEYRSIAEALENKLILSSSSTFSGLHYHLREKTRKLINKHPEWFIE